MKAEKFADAEIIQLTDGINIIVDAVSGDRATKTFEGETREYRKVGTLNNETIWQQTENTDERNS